MYNKRYGLLKAAGVLEIAQAALSSQRAPSDLGQCGLPPLRVQIPTEAPCVARLLTASGEGREDEAALPETCVSILPHIHPCFRVSYLGSSSA